MVANNLIGTPDRESDKSETMPRLSYVANELAREPRAECGLKSVHETSLRNQSKLFIRQVYRYRAKSLYFSASMNAPRTRAIAVYHFPRHPPNRRIKPVKDLGAASPEPKPVAHSRPQLFSHPSASPSRYATIIRP